MKLSMPRYDQAPVLVVGDVMLDRYWHGGTSRISPEAPVPVVKVEQIEDRPGGAANVALNIAALGAPAVLVGVTGADEAAHSLRDSLAAAGVQAHFQQIAAQPVCICLHGTLGVNGDDDSRVILQHLTGRIHAVSACPEENHTIISESR